MLGSAKFSQVRLCYVGMSYIMLGSVTFSQVRLW
jgi:hypothetical protein